MSADSESLGDETSETNLPSFGLGVLFYVTAVVAAAIALLGGSGIILAAIVLLYWLIQSSSAKNPAKQKATEGDQTALTNPRSTWASFFKVLLVIGVLVLLFCCWCLPTGGGRPAAYRVMHMNTMRQICLAIANYESANGHFPPAYIADEDGKPMHSWRVLILPYLENNAIYEQYDFDEPWDGPNNAKLANKLSWRVYGEPRNSDSDDVLTGFKLVTGPETAFEGDQTKGYGDIWGGTSNTIMLVYDNSKPVNWMSPEDVTIDEAVQLFDRDNKTACASRVVETKFRKSTFYYSSVGLFDASVNSMGLLDDPSVLRQSFAIAETPETFLDEIDFDYPHAEFENKPQGYILVLINLFLAFMPWYWIGTN